MFATPADTPVIVPLTTSAAAIAGVPDVHAPPVVALPSVIDEPAQTTAVPVIGAGSAFTVIILVIMQPVGKV
jgi:hypothetical protein